MAFPPAPPKAATASAFNEIKANPPKILAKTAKKKGTKAAAKQKVAIGLNKARAASGMAKGSTATGTAAKSGKTFNFR